MKVYIKKTHPLAQLPKRATEYAGGWDVIATEIEKVSNDFVICKLGFIAQLPAGYKLTIVPRSSLTKTHWVMQNSPGLGDPDFFGEYQIRFRAMPINFKLNDPLFTKEDELVYPEFPYSIGERIGQVYIEKIIDTEFIEVDEIFKIGVRNPEGFGTTGK